MPSRIALLCTVVFMAGALAGADEPSKGKENLTLVVGQTEFLSLEPILVTVQLHAKEFAELPTDVGDKSTMHFEFKPATGQAQTKQAVKPRAGAKPLPFEAKIKAARTRIYDLLEWYQLPAEGSFSVRAVVGNKDRRVESPWVSFSIRRPDKKDPEWGPVDRLHHIPWSNYITDAFCGDTFDVTKRWPDSKLAKYCHYWNGLHYQHKKEYDKAAESFKFAADRYPDFLLRDYADFALAECLLAQNKRDEAAKRFAELFKRIKERTPTGDGDSNPLRLTLSDARGRAVAQLWQKIMNSPELEKKLKKGNP
jgi:hypothetical protein